MEIYGTTTAEVWLQACEHVATKPRWEEHTLILHVASPVRMRARDRAVAEKLDTFLREHDALPNHTVAETIFPAYEYMHRGPEGVFTAYPEVLYPKLKKHPRRGWGRYAERLLRRKRADGTTWSPLEKTIEKLQSFRSRNTFDIAVAGGAADLDDEDEGVTIALYDDNLDGMKPRQLPCLSHLSFHVLPGDRLHLTALYRSHYYVQRLYGNLLGLARLQDFVAQQAGKMTGELVCHSTYAKLETCAEEARWKKADVQRLLQDARRVFEEASANVGGVHQEAR